MILAQAPPLGGAILFAHTQLCNDLGICPSRPIPYASKR